MTTRLVRLAGRATLADGSRLVWSVADGRRGRRWRSARSMAGRLIRSWLAETSVDGDLVRLEVAETDGLLTLHPDTAGTTLHGNIVGPDGVLHLTFGWSRDHVVIGLDEPLLGAIIAGRVSRDGRSEGERTLHGVVLRVGPDVVDAATVVVARVGASGWRLREAGLGEVTLELDRDGLSTLPGEIRWPLER